MEILVVIVENIDKYPPAATACRAMLELGHHVTLLCRNSKNAPRFLSDNVDCNIIDLGIRPCGSFGGLQYDFRTRKLVERLIKSHSPDFDVVWTCTDYSARDCGPILLQPGIRHVMQLMELVDGVPAFSRRESLPFRSKLLVMQARAAFRVVVPEYNRSFIQQALWRIPSRPIVLPNKPIVGIDDSSVIDDKYLGVLERFKTESRKIILYQGVFSIDRNFLAIMDAVDQLGDEYALYLMGVRDDENGARIRAQAEGHKGVVPIPFVHSPQHLAFTRFGRIGLLPYRPGYGRESPLNALYCAPNKLWEYSRYGLPMLGSDVPGLTTLFASEGIGKTVDIDDADAIAVTIRSIEKDYEGYSSRSSAYFNSIDVVEIVRRILEGS